MIKNRENGRKAIVDTIIHQAGKEAKPLNSNANLRLSFRVLSLKVIALSDIYLSFQRVIACQK